METIHQSPEDRVADLGNAMSETTSTGTTPDSQDSFLADRVTYLETVVDRAGARIAELEQANRDLRNADIEGDDPRLASFWDKAQRIAEHAGFCAEFDRIADALGGPTRRMEWSGTTTVTATVTLSVPVFGIASRDDLDTGDLEYEIDRYAVLQALQDRAPDMMAYDIDEFEDQGETEVTHSEPATD